MIRWILNFAMLHKIKWIHRLFTAIVWAESLHKNLFDNDEIGGIYIWKDDQTKRIQSFNFVPSEANRMGRKLFDQQHNKEFKDDREKEIENQSGQ